MIEKCDVDLQGYDLVFNDHGLIKLIFVIGILCLVIAFLKGKLDGERQTNNRARDRDFRRVCALAEQYSEIAECLKRDPGAGTEPTGGDSLTGAERHWITAG